MSVEDVPLDKRFDEVGESGRRSEVAGVGCPIVGRLSYDNIIGCVLLDLLNYKEF
jgi:hypothetical protein